MFIGALARTAAWMRRQSLRRTAAMIANPHAHIATSAMGSQLRSRRAIDAGGCKLSSGNGLLIWFIATETADGVGIFKV